MSFYARLVNVTLEDAVGISFVTAELETANGPDSVQLEKTPDMTESDFIEALRENTGYNDIDIQTSLVGLFD